MRPLLVLNITFDNRFHCTIGNRHCDAASHPNLKSHVQTGELNKINLTIVQLCLLQLNWFYLHSHFCWIFCVQNAV